MSRGWEDLESHPKALSWVCCFRAKSQGHEHIHSWLSADWAPSSWPGGTIPANTEQLSRSQPSEAWGQAGMARSIWRVTGRSCGNLLYKHMAGLERSKLNKRWLSHVSHIHINHRQTCVPHYLHQYNTWLDLEVFFEDDVGIIRRSLLLIKQRWNKEARDFKTSGWDEKSNVLNGYVREQSSSDATQLVCHSFIPTVSD